MSFIPSVSGNQKLSEVSPPVLKWIQNQLSLGGYDVGVVDGVYGPKTAKAFSEFKKDFYLGFPDLVGKSTLDALFQLKKSEETSEQDLGLNQKPLPNAGSRTGNSATLPVVGLVYSNEWILPGSYMTWGEMTKNLKRIPLKESEVRNIQRVAETFGKIRSKFNSPIGITSGFRPAHLKIGVANSQHIPGKAADIYPLNGNFSSLLTIIKGEPSVKGIGLGQAKGFLHMDIRNSSRVIFKY
jgi:peptidoglycan hydrolase-like protein with peptidoglycan-binding domain